MIRRLGDRYPQTDHSLSLLAGSYYPAYSGNIEIPGYRLGFHVSLLGPCYGIHRTGAPGEEPAAQDLAREIEATYPGYQPIPPELGDLEVPDVLNLGMVDLGKITIYSCLLSELWEGSSGPWPPPADTSPHEYASPVRLDPPVPSNVTRVAMGVTPVHTGVPVRETDPSALRRAAWDAVALPSAAMVQSLGGPPLALLRQREPRARGRRVEFKSVRAVPRRGRAELKRSDLLSVVYRFYPRGLLLGTAAYDGSDERHLQEEAAQRGAAEYPKWKAMIDRLCPHYPLWDRWAVCYPARSGDLAYSAHVEIGEHRLGFHVSLLGPYYGIHRTGAPHEEPAAFELARQIEATYPGYEPIPRAFGNEVVPDVVSLGKTTIYECLFSPAWERSSGPAKGTISA